MKRLFVVAMAAHLACVQPPRPTAGMLELLRHPRARIDGRVVEVDGRPVSGLYVEAVPRGKDVPWSPGSKTDSDGRFVLSLAAPAAYAFVLTDGDRTVVTDDPRDPSRVFLQVAPGERRDGIELLFLREEWKRVLESRPDSSYGPGVGAKRLVPRISCSVKPMLRAAN